MWHEPQLTYRVLPLEVLIQRRITPANALSAVQEAHHQENMVFMKYLACNHRVGAREPLIFSILVRVSACSFSVPGHWTQYCHMRSQHLVTTNLLEDELRIRSSALLSCFIVDIGDEIQKLHRLDHAFVYALVGRCGSDFEPACFAFCPYRVVAVGQFAV
jgi:hypothetical protein